MQLCSAPLDHDRPGDKIEDDIRLRTCGKLDLLGQNSVRLLEGGWIIDVDGKYVVAIDRPRERRCHRGEQEDDQQDQTSRVSQHPSENHDRGSDAGQAIYALQIVLVAPDATMGDVLP